jgi:ketosteroid isomerase-like protein
MSGFTRRGIAVALMFGMIASGLAVSGVASAEDRNAESVVKEFLTNWDARNVEAMMASYTENAAVIMSEGQRFNGKDSIEALMQNFAADFSSPAPRGIPIR